MDYVTINRVKLFSICLVCVLTGLSVGLIIGNQSADESLSSINNTETKGQEQQVTACDKDNSDISVESASSRQNQDLGEVGVLRTEALEEGDIDRVSADDSETADEDERLESMRELLSDLSNLEPMNEVSLAGNALDLIRIEEGLRTLMHSSPEHLEYVINQVRDSLPGRRRDLLLSLVVQSNSPQAQAYARELLLSDDPEHIITGLKMIRDSGQSTPEIQADLLTLLHNGSSVDVIEVALEALPQKLLEPTDQLMVLDTLANYQTHTDEKVRAVAIEKSVLLSDPNMGAELLAQGLSDDSSQVRAAAAFSAASSGIKTESLRQQLLQVLENPDEEWSVRHHAFNALGEYRDLRIEEYEILKRFETELTLVSENHSG